MKTNKPIDDIVDIAKQFVGYFEEVEEKIKIKETNLRDINESYNIKNINYKK